MPKAKMLGPEEIAAVLRHVEAESRYPERDRVMVLLSVRAALRASEIAGLSWGHVLTADGSAVAAEIDLPRQVTKGAKRARLIPIHKELKRALEALMALWPDRVAPGQPVVFSERGRYGANGVAQFGYRGLAAAQRGTSLRLPGRAPGGRQTVAGRKQSFSFSEGAFPNP